MQEGDGRYGAFADHDPGLRRRGRPHGRTALSRPRRDHPERPGAATPLARRCVPVAHRTQHRRRRPRSGFHHRAPNARAGGQPTVSAVSNKAPIAAAVKPVKLPTSAVVVDAMVVARRNLFVVGLMIGVGTAVGFRFHNGFVPAVAAVLVALMLGYCLSWVFALIGLSVPDPESAQLAGFLPIFPLVFASSVFTSIKSMPGWLQAFAKVQPITRAANTVRALTQGGAITRDLLWTIAWSLATVAVFAPLAVRRYRNG